MSMRDILEAMVEKGASDLHLVEGNPPSLIVDGRLTFHGNTALRGSELKLFLDEILRDDPRKEKFLREKELDVAFELEGKARFRINAYFQRGSVAFSVRMIPLRVPGLKELHLPEEAHEVRQNEKRAGAGGRARAER